MPRGITTLEQIVANVRMKSNRSPNRNFGKDQYASIVDLVQTIQYFLYWDHDWPFLRADRTITLAAGQRYYDVPDDMNFERISRVRTNGNNIWTDMDRFIDVVEDYNFFDPDDDERQSPAEKWDIVNTVAEDGNPIGNDQLEVWPLAENNVDKVKFYGTLNLAPFVADDDVCTLDNVLIELFASGELLTGDERANAKSKLAQANRLYAKMRAGASRQTPVNSFSMGGAEHFTGRDSRRVRVIAPQNAT